MSSGGPPKCDRRPAPPGVQRTRLKPTAHSGRSPNRPSDMKRERATFSVHRITVQPVRQHTEPTLAAAAEAATQACSLRLSAHVSEARVSCTCMRDRSAYGLAAPTRPNLGTRSHYSGASLSLSSMFALILSVSRCTNCSLDGIALLFRKASNSCAMVADSMRVCTSS